MRTKTTTETYEHLCNMLDKYDKVYYGRFGDGDFAIMDGIEERFHTPSKTLQNEMQQAFKINHEQYLIGVVLEYEKEPGMTQGVFAPPSNSSEITEYIKNELKISDSAEFESPIMFHYISVFKQDLMKSFLEKYIRPKKKMFIGSVEQKGIEKLIGKIDYYINIPERDAYHSIDEWWPKIIKHIDDVELVLPAAGMAGRVINKRLWNLEKNIHSIDLGSVVDAACGKGTRTWIDKVAWYYPAENKIENLLV